MFSYLTAHLDTWLQVALESYDTSKKHTLLSHILFRLSSIHCTQSIPGRRGAGAGLDTGQVTSPSHGKHENRAKHGTTAELSSYSWFLSYSLYKQVV